MSIYAAAAIIVSLGAVALGCYSMWLNYQTAKILKKTAEKNKETERILQELEESERPARLPFMAGRFGP